VEGCAGKKGSGNGNGVVRRKYLTFRPCKGRREKNRRRGIRSAKNEQEDNGVRVFGNAQLE